MLGRLWLLLYRIVCWRASRLPPETGLSLRAKWALRFYSLSSGGQDDDFAAELFDLIREMPALLDQLDQQASGSGSIARHKRMLLTLLRQAYERGDPSLY